MSHIRVRYVTILPVQSQSKSAAKSSGGGRGGGTGETRGRGGHPSDFSRIQSKILLLQKTFTVGRKYGKYELFVGP